MYAVCTPKAFLKNTNWFRNQFNARKFSRSFRNICRHTKCVNIQRQLENGSDMAYLIHRQHSLLPLRQIHSSVKDVVEQGAMNSYIPVFKDIFRQRTKKVPNSNENIYLRNMMRSPSMISQVYINFPNSLIELKLTNNRSDVHTQKQFYNLYKFSMNNAMKLYQILKWFL